MPHVTIHHKHPLCCVQVVDNFQYELPEDFEDEEIEEEEAFTEEDKKLFAHMFKSEAGEEDDEQAGQGAQLTRDDFSDDVRSISTESA